MKLNQIIPAAFLCLLGTTYSFSSFAFTYSAFKDSLQAEDSTVNQYLNWYNQDPEDDFTPGSSVDKAYKFLARKKEVKPIVVAVIDTGVDTLHDELKGRLWINTGEIPGNGKDDDANGYTDDIYGWNFLGGSNGEILNFENLELTRVYRKYRQRFGSMTKKEVDKKDRKEFKLFKKIELKYQVEVQKNRSEKERLEKFIAKYTANDSLLKKHFGKDSISEQELQEITAADETLSAAGAFMLKLKKNGFDMASLKEYVQRLKEESEYYLNTEYDGRTMVGDDPETDNGTSYGNPNVFDLNGHGTHVSGIIAANRNNGPGMKGVADHAKIMTLRAVPDGDERDKDVARAIRYAADNGASVINMSFGKLLSPQKDLVDQAVKYAESKGVLLIHAAGNDGENNDKVPHYPSAGMLSGDRVSNMITVGASSSVRNEFLAGGFSNYGHNSVDVFAPGVNIYSLKPGNGYVVHSGTSMATPVTAGVAALLMSYFPELTAGQIKDIMLKTVTPYDNLKVLLPGSEKEKQVRFSSLSSTGGIVNAYAAAKLAEATVKEMKSKK